jgi:CubicO group peptidase (beta-lactamase class C family)
LLAGIVRRVANERLDEFVARRILRPLGIQKFTWLRDPSGETLAYAGLALTARDLGRVGAMLLGDGQFAGRRIVPRAWLDLALQGDDAHGLLFEIFERRAPRLFVTDTSLASVSFGAKLSPLLGRAYDDAAAFWMDAGPLLLPAERAALARDAAASRLPFESRRQITFGHTGSFGQWLVVMPSARAIGVRLLRETENETPLDFARDLAAALR